MQIQFSISVILLGILIVLGMFSAIILFFQKPHSIAKRFLGTFLFTVALWLIDSFFTLSGIYGQNPDFYFLPIYYSFAFGPLIYFYVRSLTDSTFEWQRGYVLHFVPVIIQAILYWILTFQAYDIKRTYWLEVHQPYTYRIEFDGTFISLAIYLFFTIRLILRYQHWIANNLSDLHRIRLNWLKLILTVLLLLCFQWFVEVILRDFYQDYYHFNYSIFLLGVLTVVLAFGGILQSNLHHLKYEGEVSPDDSEGQVIIDESTVDRIKQEMEDNQAFLNPDLTLKLFAEQCKLPPRRVSEHINHGLKLSFHDYVNKNRVEEVKKMLVGIDLNVYTLQSIAYDCGFNSKATFNRIFKSYTNQTPTQYLKNQS